MIGVLIVDDHPMIVDAWRTALEAEADVRVEAVAGDLAEARRVVGEMPPFDVVVIDIRLGEDSGFQLLPDLDLRRTAVVVVSAHGSPAYVDAAQRLGVRGFFLKTSRTADLVDAVRRVAGGSTAWDPAAIRQSAGGRWHPLSEREYGVVKAVVAGRSNSEIGGDLGIATKTVEAHLSRLYARFEVQSRAELVNRAKDEGWLDLPPR